MHHSLEKLSINVWGLGTLRHYKLVESFISLATLLSKDDKRVDLAVKTFILVEILCHRHGLV